MNWNLHDKHVILDALIRPGLSDRGQEGVWRWTDGSPLTYTDWAVDRRDGLLVHQPDGARVEDCSLIALNSLHSTRSWQDIPCAFNQVRQYVCELGKLAGHTVRLQPGPTVRLWTR